MACFGEFMPHRIAGGGRKGKVHKDNIRVQFCMLYFAWEQHLFLLYRKFLKSSEIVYNRLEIKNDITKERRGLRHDVVYEVFCFGLG